MVEIGPNIADSILVLVIVGLLAMLAFFKHKERMASIQKDLSQEPKNET